MLSLLSALYHPLRFQIYGIVLDAIYFKTREYFISTVIFIFGLLFEIGIERWGVILLFFSLFGTLDYLKGNDGRLGGFGWVRGIKKATNDDGIESLLRSERRESVGCLKEGQDD